MKEKPIQHHCPKCGKLCSYTYVNAFEIEPTDTWIQKKSKKKISRLGLVGLILGIITLLGFILLLMSVYIVDIELYFPLGKIYILCYLLSSAGMACGMAGTISALKGKKTKIGIPIWGIALSMISFVAPFFVLFFFT
ncbi:hypothetical protein ACFL02_07555 [Planctomycetota bacterium]